MYCGKEFTAKTTVTKYCSHKCNSKDYKRKIKELKIKVSDKDTNKIVPQHIKNPKLNEKEILSIKEVCEFVGMSKSSVYRLINDEVINPIKIRNRVFISREELKKLLKI